VASASASASAYPVDEASAKEVVALGKAFSYYDMASKGDYIGTYFALSSYSQSFYTPEEWISANMTLRTIEVEYTVTEANMISDDVAEVHLIMDFPDGTSQERWTRFVIENHNWVHDLTAEEYALFDAALDSPLT